MDKLGNGEMRRRVNVREMMSEREGPKVSKLVGHVDHVNKKRMTKIMYKIEIEGRREWMEANPASGSWMGSERCAKCSSEAQR